MGHKEHKPAFPTDGDTGVGFSWDKLKTGASAPHEPSFPPAPEPIAAARRTTMSDMTDLSEAAHKAHEAETRSVRVGRAEQTTIVQVTPTVAAATPEEDKAHARERINEYVTSVQQVCWLCTTAGAAFSVCG